MENVSKSRPVYPNDFAGRLNILCPTWDTQTIGENIMMQELDAFTGNNN